MDRAWAGRLFRPVVIFGLVLVVGLVASFFWGSRATSERAIDLGTGAVATTEAPTSTSVMPDDTIVVSTTEWSGESSPITEPAQVDPNADFGPPVTVGDYTQFCPALDELADLDASRSLVAGADPDAQTRWQVERRAALETINRTLNFRSPEADADMATVVATADDRPSDGPLAPDASAALDRIRDFAVYSCEVNSTLPPQVDVEDLDTTTTTGP